MAIQITIIGTGQIGASVGLALGTRHDLFVRVGHDKDHKVANRAKELGAFDRVESNLPRSVDGSAIVLVALPLDQVRDTFQLIASELQDEAIVIDTAPVKAEVFRWADELLPPRCYYIGTIPVLNPAYLHMSASGVEAARNDLFTNGLIAIVSPQGVPEEAIKLVTDFSKLLGASHLFVDPLELDSLIAATHILPQLLAAAMLNSTVDQPGWRDGCKLTGRPYAAIAEAANGFDRVDALTCQAIGAHEHLVRWIDVLMDNLYLMRQQLVTGEADKLHEQLAQAQLGYTKWLKDKETLGATTSVGINKVDYPTAGQEFRRMFTFGAGRRPKKSK